MAANLTFLTRHAWACCASHTTPGVLLRDIAASLGITKRGAYGIVTAQSGSIVKQKNGRRNRYQIHAHVPPPEPTSSLRPLWREWPREMSRPAAAFARVSRSQAGVSGQSRSSESGRVRTLVTISLYPPQCAP